MILLENKSRIKDILQWKCKANCLVIFVKQQVQLIVSVANEMADEIIGARDLFLSITRKCSRNSMNNIMYSVIFVQYRN